MSLFKVCFAVEIFQRAGDMSILGRIRGQVSVPDLTGDSRDFRADARVSRQ